MQHYVIRFVSDLQQVSGFILELSFSSTGKTDCHDITEILLKMAFFFVRGTCDWMSWMRSLSINRNVVVTSWEDGDQNCDQLSDMTVLILQQVITLPIINTSQRLTVIAEIFYILSGQLVQLKSTGYRTEPYFTWTDLTFWILWIEVFGMTWRYELVSAYLAFPTASLV